MHRRSLAAVVVAFVSVSAPAAAQPTCAGEGSPGDCAEEFRLIPAAFGQQPIDTHFRAGEQVRRAFFYDDYARPVVAVTFVRSPGSGPRVAVSTPTGSVSGAGTSIEAALSPEAWEELIERSTFFHRALGPEPRRQARAAADEAIVVCSHGWGTYVEASDPAALDSWRPAGVRQRGENTCDRGLTSDFARWMAAYAVSKLPHCSALAEHGFAPRLLADCARFTGDRAAAAELYDTLRKRGSGRALQETVTPLFASDAHFVWEGARVDRDIAQAWRARTQGDQRSSYFQWSAHGENAQRVRTSGFLERWQDEPGERTSLWRAPVEMVWERRLGYFQIVRAVIGRFERLEGRCPPDLLTGAERENNCFW